MPSSKSKGRKRQHKQRQQRLDRLRRKLEQGSLGDLKFVVEPKGQVKMSDVLERFAEPYLEFVDTTEQHRKLFTLAALAWNASFLPPGEQAKMIDEVLGAGFPADAGELKAGLKEIVGALIARKQALFSGYTRKIINFELTDAGNSFHLTVASTL
jgi:hypothetical protein